VHLPAVSKAGAKQGEYGVEWPFGFKKIGKNHIPPACNDVSPRIRFDFSATHEARA